ncbi:MAG: hypothetical protein HXM58_05050 [Megasphaera micronuciformis]|jgi:hypothetical protein|nr:hypothetical protein [Megasphaera micronuciformis]
MVVLEKQNNKNGIVLYHYYPNGGDEYGYGVIAIDTKTGEIGIEKEDDCKHFWYLDHAFAAVRGFVQNMEFPDKYRVVWC